MKNQTLKWILVVGARPNFMKVAPIVRAIKSFNGTNHTDQMNQINYCLVHTGQHYDYEMSQAFFEDLELPRPDIYLGIGSGTHAEQTGRVMIEFEKVLFKERPHLVIVVGDVNSTLACALASVKLRIPVAHVEAGLRSFDRTMPEEINRLLTDAISDYLFTPSPDGDENLKREGIPEDKIFLVGDIMIDSLLFNLEKAKKSTILEQLGLRQRSFTDHCPLTTDYCLLTLHRPSNVDNKDAFLKIINALTEISKHIPIIFPIHPRTRKQIEALGLGSYFVYHDFNSMNPTNSITQRNQINQRNCINLINPLGYLDFLNLMIHSKFVMTDSGGIQEETTVLNIPCLTLRDTTERPLTITYGSNKLVNAETLVSEVKAILNFNKSSKVNMLSVSNSNFKKAPEFWDGHTAERIVKIFTEKGLGG